VGGDDQSDGNSDHETDELDNDGGSHDENDDIISNSKGD